MITLLRPVLLPLLFFGVGLAAQDTTSTRFEPVPELGYRVVPDFFKLPIGMNFGEASAVALNSKGHIFVFHRSNPMLIEFDKRGKFLRSIGEGLFAHPHGLRIDAETISGPPMTAIILS